MFYLPEEIKNVVIYGLTRMEFAEVWDTLREMGADGNPSQSALGAYKGSNFWCIRLSRNDFGGMKLSFIQRLNALDFTEVVTIYRKYTNVDKFINGKELMSSLYY